MEKIDLYRIRAKMMRKIKTQYYALLAAHIPMECTENIPVAACVHSIKNGFIHMEFNPETFGKCNEDEQEFIMAHEILHVMFNTLLLKDLCPDTDILNKAADMEINSFLRQEGFKLPQTAKGILPEDLPGLTEADSCKGTLFYYKKIQEYQQKHGDDGEGEGEELSDISKEGKDFIKRWLKAKADSKFEDSEISEVTKQLIQQQIQKIQEETSELIGKDPLNIKGNQLEAAFKPPTLNWKTLLKRFATSTVAAVRKSAKNRYNKKYPDFPGSKIVPKVKCLIGVDSSGSVSDSDLTLALAEINSIFVSQDRNIKLDICAWDAEVGDVEVYTRNFNFERTKSGGTNASCFIEYVNTNKKDYDLAVCITDGYIENEPIISKLPFLFIITPDGGFNFKTPHKVVKMII